MVVQSNVNLEKSILLNNFGFLFEPRVIADIPL
jgi:hypothetical protein